MRQACPEHGRYQTGCEGCLVQSRAYGVWLTKQKAYGRPPMVPADDAKAHIDHLISVGWLRSEISRASGVSPVALHKIVHGQTKRVRRWVHDAILTTTTGVELMVCAVGSQRRIQHLYRQGWSGAAIAEGTGVTDSAISQIRLGHSKTTHRETADAISVFFRTHWDVDGGSVRAKNTARKHGFVSILAWDDPDNPNSPADATPIRDTTADRVAALEDLADLGEPWTDETAQRAGFSNRNSAHDALRRLDRPDIRARLERNFELWELRLTA